MCFILIAPTKPLGQLKPNLVLLPFVNWVKKLINSMIENMTSIIQLFLLDVTPNMLLDYTFIRK